MVREPEITKRPIIHPRHCERSAAIHECAFSTMDRHAWELMKITLRTRCVAAAQKHFSLDEGVQRYVAVYQQLGAAA
jgi:hypothetical protein